jgi:hypothetical protein
LWAIYLEAAPGWLESITEARFRQASSLVGLLLTPVAASAGALAAWRFGVEAGWTNAFFISQGFLSHWQVWCAFAISVQACARILSRGATAQQILAVARARVAS